MTSSSDTEDDTNVWSNLKTNKTCDFVSRKANSSEMKIVKKYQSNDQVDAGRNQLNILSPPTPHSLLIQSLIKQLCEYVMPNDSAKSLQLYNTICGNLHKLRFIDESYQVSEFENIRLSYEQAMKALFKIAKENALPIENLQEWPLNNKVALEWSRYYREFQELEKIGEGGFGDVFKARHILDLNCYAIKKILIKSTSTKGALSHLKEIKTFAALSHPNIVQYCSCWLEPMISFEVPKTKMIAEQSWDTTESVNIRVTKSEKDSLRLQTNDSFSINFEHSENYQETTGSLTKEESRSRLESIRKISHSNAIPHVKLAWSTLFIQMKLCESTLKQFIDDRNECGDFSKFYNNFENLRLNSLNAVAFKIFQQLCNGLEYIHNKNIVHHDLKPSNVFITLEQPGNAVCFQLGDFGLSCPLETNEMVIHEGIGTRLYAAKEQLEGKICTKKSDIYSLGIILLEILTKNSTVMECTKKVECIKRGDCPPDVELSMCELIKSLLCQNADKRPDVSELKQKIAHFLEKSDELLKLQEEMVLLKKMIEEKDVQIEKLTDENTKLKRELSK